jgi:hypothetical protein
MDDAPTDQADLQKDLTDATGLDGVRLVGAQPFAAFDARLKALLAKP